MALLTLFDSVLFQFHHAEGMTMGQIFQHPIDNKSWHCHTAIFDDDGDMVLLYYINIIIL